MEKRIVVPDGMAQAAVEATCSTRLGMDEHDALIDKALAAALRWASENPRRPTDREFGELVIACRDQVGQEKWEQATEWMRAGILCHEWQRRMFYAPEPEVLEAIKDLLWTPLMDNRHGQVQMHNEQLLEAYRRGQQGK